MWEASLFPTRLNACSSGKVLTVKMEYLSHLHLPKKGGVNSSFNKPIVRVLLLEKAVIAKNNSVNVMDSRKKLDTFQNTIHIFFKQVKL